MPTTQPDPSASSPVTADKIEEQVQDLLKRMTLAEKVHQMSGDGSFWRDGPRMLRAYNYRPIPAGESPELGIPGLHFSDGPRGIVMNHATCFPVAMARGASWDIELEERVGDAMGVEARSLGANFFAGVCVNLLRHPAWGRAQETYGEDPHHLGKMGAALVRGVQRHAMACVKHLACNSLENARFKVDVQVDERTLREVYLPHFKRCVDEGAVAVMSAYNKVNGEWCGHHHHLLREILKGEWGFEGFVISDFVYGVRDGKAAALGGLDIEMPFTQHYGKKLISLVRNGEVPEAVIDEAVSRILRQKLHFNQEKQDGIYTERRVASPSHCSLAREVAAKSVVLLKNEPPNGHKTPLLPLDPSKILTLALIGTLIDQANIGDRGSSEVRPPYVVTPLAGLRAIQEETKSMQIRSYPGTDPAQASKTATGADIAIVVVGYTYKDEGEYIEQLWVRKGGDRDSLNLSREDEALIKAVVATNPNTMVIMMGGSAIITENWRKSVPAILMAWYPGMEGGNALADVLTGRVNPSAKLPCSFPKAASQLPYFDKNAKTIDYGYFHGYRLLERDQNEPAFPFGFGLSYTRFEYRDLKLEKTWITPDSALRASVEITNSGAVAGEEICQLYIGYIDSAVERPRKELKGFQKVNLEAGESARVTFEIPARDLAYYNVEQRCWVIEESQYHLYIGSSSADADLLITDFWIKREYRIDS